MKSKMSYLLNTTVRRKLLRRIKLHAVLNFTHDLSPRTIWAMSAALIVLIIVGVVDGFNGLFLILPCAVFVACYLLGRAPLTWSEVLEADLADYDPLDIEAFQCLQAEVTSAGSIEKEAFDSWLTRETIALETIEGAIKKTPKHRFINRKL